MNLLKRRIKGSNILKFREYQYNLLPHMLNICFDYLESFGLKIKTKDLSIEYEKSVQYISLRHYDTQTIKIKLDKNKKDYFLQFYVPTLIDSMFFRLNGALYIPIIYCVDAPIVFKEKSIKLSSLFKSITIFTNQNRVIFLGTNMPIFRFFRLFYSENETKEILKFLGVQNLIIEPFDFVLEKISNILQTKSDITKIHQRINKLFFDNWTSELYKKYYSIKTPDLKLVLNKLIEIKQRRNKISFIDLRYKRLVFLEYLLNPLFKSVSTAVNSLLYKKPVTKINIGVGDIIKFFFTSRNPNNNSKGLEKSCFFDIVNGYSAVLGSKVSFKNPQGSSLLPTQVSDIHSTFKGKICPITVSNQKPGTISSLVPKQRVDLKFGLFLDD